MIICIGYMSGYIVQYIIDLLIQRNNYINECRMEQFKIGQVESIY